KTCDSDSDPAAARRRVSPRRHRGHGDFTETSGFSVPLRVLRVSYTRKLEFLARLERFSRTFFLCVPPWERTHPACWASDTHGTLEACAPKGQQAQPLSASLRCGLWLRPKAAALKI